MTLYSASEVSRMVGIVHVTRFADARGITSTRRPRTGASQCSHYYTAEQVEELCAAYNTSRQKGGSGRNYVPPASPPPAGSAEERILRVAAAAYGVTIAELLGRTRHTPAMNARRAAIALFAREGYAISEICHILGRDHATVLHSLVRCGVRQGKQRARATSIWGQKEFVQEVAKLHTELLQDLDYEPAHRDFVPDLGALLSSATSRHPAAGAVCAYVRSVLRPDKPRPVALLYHGLHALATDEVLRTRVQAALTRVGQAQVMYSAACHARQLGFGWG